MYTFLQPNEALLHFQNVEYSRFYLEKRYQKKQLENATEKAYSNTEPFLAYLQYGDRCLKEAQLISPQLQPIFFFMDSLPLLKPVY